MQRPVLILGCVPRITVPIARSLHSHGIRVDVGCFSVVEAAPRSRAVSDFFRLPTSHDRTDHVLLESLTRLIAERQYDMLIPANDLALAFVSQHDARLRELLYLACPSPQAVQRILDKSRTMEIAGNVRVPTPPTYRVSSLTELEALSPQLRFPMVAKPYDKSDEMDFKVRYYPTYESLRRALSVDETLGRKVLLQEFAQGNGVGIEVLMHHGESVAVFQHRRLQELPASGGVAAVAIAEPPEPMLINQALALLRALEWEGIAMVEFRYDRTQQRSSLMEVNGRYWGTLALAIQSGVDFPWYQWQIAHGGEPAVPSNYTVGRHWRWSAGYLSRWHDLARDSIRKAFRHPAGLKKLIPSPTDLSARDALWDLNDPMPAIAEMLRTVKDLAVSDAKGIGRALSRNDPRS